LKRGSEGKNRSGLGNSGAGNESIPKLKKDVKPKDLLGGQTGGEYLQGVYNSGPSGQSEGENI